ncbi:MAG: hypothetical protein KIC64_11215 [Prevotella buccae]|jgi:hypothetical protein|uniref:hypothetical protein n=1 Tax=Segatella buccae TaxID=28126 RepID=UPI00242BF958|nr:hypothetical protein [Segatella buccae]MBS5896377.1 hypothetical protein [Segatella buccae]
MKRKLRFSILMLLMAVCGAANVQAENVTFTFNTDEGLKALNIAKPERGGKTELNAEYKAGEVSMKAEKSLIWNKKGKKDRLDLRVYKNGSLTFSVPADYTITEVKMEGTKTINLSNLTNGSWTGDQKKISFSATGAQYINTIMVTYKKKTPAPTSVSVTIGETGYATLYYSKLALTVPAGVKGYTCSLAGGSFNMDEAFAEGQTIPAGTGVLLKAETGTYTFKVSSETGSAVADNWLKGSDEKATTEGGERYYMLSLDAKNTAGSVGFYWGADNGEAFTNGAHKAYLCVKPGVAGAKTCYRFDGQTTAIDGTRADKPTTADGAVYNLAGQRVDRSYKGVVIKNGKKYIQ